MNKVVELATFDVFKKTSTVKVDLPAGLVRMFPCMSGHKHAVSPPPDSLPKAQYDKYPKPCSSRGVVERLVSATRYVDACPSIFGNDCIVTSVVLSIAAEKATAQYIISSKKYSKLRKAGLQKTPRHNSGLVPQVHGHHGTTLMARWDT